MNSIITKFHVYLLTEKLVSSNTFEAYKRDVDQLAAYLDSHKKTLASLDVAAVKEYLRYLCDELKLTPRSITRKISALKVLFYYLNEYHSMPNLTDDLAFPKLEKKLPNFLSEEEVQRLLLAAERDQMENSKRNKMILYLLYVSGMRISELINLQLSHLHFDTGFIDVRGKGGKSRMVPIPQAVLELLKNYIETAHKAFTQNGKRQTDYLFPILYGGAIKPITRQAVWGILKHLCKKSGINRSISPHQLRHSLATHMLKNGADLRSLQMLLGHENLATVQIYTHLDTSYLRAIYDKKHPRS